MESEARPDPVEHALTRVELRRAAWTAARPQGSIERVHPGSGWDAGTEAVQRAVDAGAGALLLCETQPPSPAARAVAALFTTGDVTTVIDGASDDLAWMHLCSDVREALVGIRERAADPAAVLRADPALESLVGAMIAATNRRTPMVIAGTLTLIAALAAQRVSSQSSAWISAGIADADNAGRAAIQRLGLTPWATMDWAVDDSTQEVILRALVEDLEGGCSQPTG